MEPNGSGQHRQRQDRVRVDAKALSNHFRSALERRQCFLRATVERVPVTFGHHAVDRGHDVIRPAGVVALQLVKGDVAARGSRPEVAGAKGPRIAQAGAGGERLARFVDRRGEVPQPEMAAAPMEPGQVEFIQVPCSFEGVNGLIQALKPLVEA